MLWAASYSIIRIISSPHRDIAPVRSFSPDWYLADVSPNRADRLGVPEPGRHIDGDAIGQRDHRANTGNRHQAPAHIIVADDGQHAAMQDAELLAKHPPDNEQRFHQYGQIGKVFDKLPDPRLELHRSDHAPLEAEVAQSWHAGRSRWQWPSIEAACDGSAAPEASDCVTSSHAPGDKVPHASSAPSRAHRCGLSC